MERTREKKLKIENKMKDWSLIERLMSRAPKKNGVYENWMFSDVNPKGFRTPAADGLDRREICTCFCKRSGTS